MSLLRRPTFSSPPFFPGGQGGRVLRLWRTALATTERGCRSGPGVPGRGLLAGLPARGEPRCCRVRFPPTRRAEAREPANVAFKKAGNPSRGLAGEWTMIAPGGFIFRARQLPRVEAFNGVRKGKRGSRSWRGQRTPPAIGTGSLAPGGPPWPGLRKEGAEMRPLLGRPSRGSCPPRESGSFLIL